MPYRRPKLTTPCPNCESTSTAKPLAHVLSKGSLLAQVQVVIFAYNSISPSPSAVKSANINSPISEVDQKTAVSKKTAVPDGMEQWAIAEQTYAAFPCSLQTIHETYQYIFETWLPQSEYSHKPVPDFEFYDKNFDPETGEGMYIYMPVQ